MSSLNILHMHTFFLQALRVFWFIIILFGEVWVFVWSLFECQWPSVLPGGDKYVPSTHVLLVADTQIQHHALLPKASWWFDPFRHFLFDVNLHKSWHVTSYLRPDAVVFLGDMLSNGRAARAHHEYKAAADKFNSIFHTDPRTEVYYIPGNNDVGLGMERSTSRMLRSFYQEFFGPLNCKFVLQNHTFVAIDSAGLVDEDYLRNGEHIPFESWTPSPNGTVSFVKQVAQQNLDSVILLGHIPLARSESARCGPLREQGTIRRGAGPGWQSTLSKQSTNFLLDTLRPSIIFSADNRDYCDYEHTIRHPDPPGDSSAQGYHVREITLKSFSMSVHIRRPGFQLLTLVDPTYVSSLPQSEPTSQVPPSLAERACFLPDQFRIYNYLYAPLFVISLLLLVRFHFLQPKKGKTRIKPPFLTLKPGVVNGIGVDRSLLPESMPGLFALPNSPGLEPMWTPFAPFTPVTPLAPTLSPKMRKPSTTSMTSVHSLYSQSRDSSLSSTTTLLDGENGKEGDCHYSIEDDELIKHFPSDLAMSTGEEPFSFPSVPKQWVQQPHGRSFARHPHIRQSSILELESFRNQIVDEETAPAATTEPFVISSVNTDSPKRTTNWSIRSSISYSFTFRGRRRRIRFGIPSRSALLNLIEFLGVGVDERGPSSSGLLDTRRRSVDGRGMKEYIGDLVIVFWPAVLLWLMINGVSMLI